MRDIVKEIKDALEKASTQCDWDSDGTFVEWKDGHPLRGTHRMIAIFNAPHPVVFKNENHENDAHLFLNAPTWLSHQQQLIDSQAKQLELAVKALELLASGNNDFPTWEDTMDVLKDVRSVAKETLSSINCL